MGSNYTYAQFEKALKDSGYRFSDADLALAKRNPDVGMSLLQYGKDYNSATTAEAKALAHQGAEALRKKFASYSGGEDGGKFYVDPNATPTFKVDYSDKKPSAPSFDKPPTYQDSYAKKKQELMDAILNRKEFAYDPSKDPVAQSYEKQYAREGRRATDNVMASAAASTGGMPSSFAVSAASQAGNQYAAKMADKIPELEQMAYSRYLQDLNLKHGDVKMVDDASKDGYNKYLNTLNQFNIDRNFDYNKYLNALNQHNNDRSFEYAVSQDKLDREYQQRQEQLQLALIKAENGDYSGLKDLGVDTSKLESRMEASSGGGGYRSDGGSSSDGSGYSSDVISKNTGSGDQNGGLSRAIVNELLGTYPDGKVPDSEWTKLVSLYGENLLRNAGFSVSRRRKPNVIHMQNGAMDYTLEEW